MKVEQEALVRRCLEGDLSSKKKFYERFSPVMFGICLRYLETKEDAQDLLHDGFIHAFQQLHLFRNEGSLEGWLRRIFVNLALERIRKKSISFQESDLTAADHVPSSFKTEEKLEMQHILTGIQQLPPACKTVFNLFVIEGYSHKEIAHMLNISENTSKAQVFRARNHLQNYLKNKR